MIMDNLIRDYQRLLKEYRTLPEDERLDVKGKILYKKIASLKIAIDRAYRTVQIFNSPVGNYKP